MDLEMRIQTTIDELNLDYGNHGDVYDTVAALTRRAMMAEARVAELEAGLAPFAKSRPWSGIITPACDWCGFTPAILELWKADKPEYHESDCPWRTATALLNGTQQESGEVQGE